MKITSRLNTSTSLDNFNYSVVDMTVLTFGEDLTLKAKLGYWLITC